MSSVVMRLIHSTGKSFAVYKIMKFTRQTVVWEIKPQKTEDRLQTINSQNFTLK